MRQLQARSFFSLLAYIPTKDRNIVSMTTDSQNVIDFQVKCGSMIVWIGGDLIVRNS